MVRVLAAVEQATPARWGIDATAGPHAADTFAGSCPVCGLAGAFVRNHRHLREGYRCSACNAALRDQGQADALVRLYGTRGAVSLAQLVREPAFAGLRIWEAGVMGSLHPHLVSVPGYVQSGYWPDAQPGSYIDGVRNEDLLESTFADGSIDLVVTSDVFEHVRRPYQAFRELYRVLSAGGRHVFSIPFEEPIPPLTVARVDTSADDDVDLLEPHYHHGPRGGLSLVYTDFGLDLVDRLGEMGFETSILHLEGRGPEVAQLVTFAACKPL